MNANYILRQLTKNAEVFRDLLHDKTKEEYLFKPDPDSWSMLEIICHLVDEEKEDFRTRLKTVLETPGTFPPPIDPEGWPVSKGYLTQNYQDKLEEFLSERKISIDWLQTIEHFNWDHAYEHVKLGPLSAKLFLSNWLAHDYLHIRQITRLNHQYLKHISEEDLSYAGTWNY